MASVEYTKSIQNDFPNQKADAGKLDAELRASDITKALDYVSIDGDTVSMWFKESLSQPDMGELNTTVLNHDGNPLNNQGIRADGVARVQVVPSGIGKKLTITGAHGEANLNGDTNFDMSFAEDREISGAWIEVSDHKNGDYLELEVVHPVSQDVLGKFGETIYIPPSGKTPLIISEGTEFIPAGILIRFKYKSVATSGTPPHVFCYARLHK